MVEWRMGSGDGCGVVKSSSFSREVFESVDVVSGLS